jgi:imidazoleglycerol phosphate synthase glutamine amidotransferase subunit HisH
MNLKVPQIGWNKVTALSDPIFNGIGEDPYCYLYIAIM